MKRFALYVYSLFVLFIIYLILILSYATLSDYQPEDFKIISTQKIGDDYLKIDSFYQVLNWNIGYAGLGEESDFFYDGGKQARTTKVNVKKNLKGIEGLLQQMSSIDFILFQELDIKSKRSYYINQLYRFDSLLMDHQAFFTYNLHVDFIPKPFLDPIGYVRSGLASFCRTKAFQVEVHQYPSSYDWPRSCLMLDRCILVKRFKTEDKKEFILINNHNSAFDKGQLKKSEMAYLKDFILKEYNAGNYVLVGGDFNQCPPNFDPKIFNEDSDYMRTYISADFMPDDWQWLYDSTIPTNRQMLSSYEHGVTNTTLIDYYLASPNIEVQEVKCLNMDFKFSDHQPVYLAFKFNGQK